MDHDPVYTILVRGQRFSLTQSQIEFDSTNYFTMCFLGDFREAQTRTLTLFRDPDLFRKVVDYLCGYTVVPFGDGFLPPNSMTRTTFVANLRADAVFYQLDGLLKQCDAAMKPAAYFSRHLIIGSRYECDEGDDIDIEMRMASNPREWKTRVGEDVLKREPFITMKRPESCVGFSELRKVAAIERFVTSRFPEYGVGAWRLVGWHMEKSRGARVNTEFMVVLEESRP
ncbi:BTB domain protein, putative [Rhizoctonia solani AG-3 Rhs1AP]|uniref:BTB domain protein, putative n=1 Tax=Rhizoctonia solani AG-3 Rhs1AP TaxID=1086054 RepID=X8J4B6_9AGAM|nr:BTB domain protein, putative [Rhizoctonia solani AG-3 Rhs1AP]